MKMELIILSCVLFFGCTREPTNPIKPVDSYHPKTDTALVWKLPIFKDTSLAFSAEIVGSISPNTFLTGYTRLASIDTNILCLYLTSDSIYKLWTWNDYFPDERQTGVWMFNESYAFVNGITAQYGVDLTNGSTLWKHKLSSDVQRSISLFGNQIFHIKNHGSKSTLYIADIAIGDWKSIFTVEGKDGFESDLNRVVGALNADGDMILYFQDRQYRYSTSTNRTDFYAYNLTKKEVLWELQDISPQTSNTSPAVLDETNRRMYFLTWHTIFCWDMDTGEEIWKVPLSAGVLASNPMLYDGKLIMKTDQGYLTAFDAETGEELYYVKQGACCIGSMIVYDGRLYYTDGRVWIVDPNTGEVIDKIRGDFQSSPPVIDSVRNVLYVMDSRYMYCYKIPE